MDAARFFSKGDGQSENLLINLGFNRSHLLLLIALEYLGYSVYFLTILIFSIFPPFINLDFFSSQKFWQEHLRDIPPVSASMVLLQVHVFIT